MSYALRRVSSDAAMKGGWLKCVPWRFAEAGDPEQAAICLQQLKDGDPTRMGPLELRQRDEFSEDLQVLERK